MSDQSPEKNIEPVLEIAFTELSKRLAAELKINPDLYGSANVEISLRAGNIVHLKHSVEVAQKL